jgi:hypothetical protein
MIAPTGHFLGLVVDEFFGRRLRKYTYNYNGNHNDKKYSNASNDDISVAVVVISVTVVVTVDVDVRRKVHDSTVNVVVKVSSGTAFAASHFTRT